jgi:hypothetical protein
LLMVPFFSTVNASLIAIAYFFAHHMNSSKWSG